MRRRRMRWTGASAFAFSGFPSIRTHRVLASSRTDDFMMPSADADALLLGYSNPHTPKKILGFSNESLSKALAPNELVTHPLDDGPLLIFGRTGSGKARSSLIPICLSTPATNSLIVVDPKGEATAITAAHRRKIGAQVHVIDPWKITSHTRSRMNPLDLIGDPTSACASDAAAVLADGLVVEHQNHDRFWDIAAKNAIGMGALLLAGHSPENWRNLGTLGDMLGSGAGPTLSGFLAAAMCSDLGAGAVRREAENLASLAMPTLASVTATLSAHLRPLTSPVIKASLGGSDIDLDAFGQGEPQTIYLVLPAENLRAFRPIMRLWLNTLIHVLARRRIRPKSRTIVLMDEAAQLGSLEAVRLLTFLLRGMSVSLVAYFQGVDQLARLYQDDWRAIVDNAGTIMSLDGGAARQRLVGVTAGDVAVASLPPYSPGNATIIRNGCVESIQKLDYLRDPELAILAAPNPYFEQRGEP